MRFCFVDHVKSYETGSGIVVEKAVSYAEPFLADHFPGAPVLPGALMVEGAIEAAVVYLRRERGFPLEDYFVTEISQGKFSAVVRPGDVLETTVTVDPGRAEDGIVAFRARGTCGGRRAFSVRFKLSPARLYDRDDDVPGDGQDARSRLCLDEQRELWTVLNSEAPRYGAVSSDDISLKEL